MNFSLNAKRRMPAKIQTLIMQQIQPQRHIVRGNMKRNVVILEPNVITVSEKERSIVEERVIDIITYEVGEASNEASNEVSNEVSNEEIEPQPCMEEPMIETLLHVVINEANA